MNNQHTCVHVLLDGHKEPNHNQLCYNGRQWNSLSERENDRKSLFVRMLRGYLNQLAAGIYFCFFPIQLTFTFPFWFKLTSFTVWRCMYYT